MRLIYLFIVSRFFLIRFISLRSSNVDLSINNIRYYFSLFHFKLEIIDSLAPFLSFFSVYIDQLLTTLRISFFTSFPDQRELTRSKADIIVKVSERCIIVRAATTCCIIIARLLRGGSENGAHARCFHAILFHAT